MTYIAFHDGNWTWVKFDGAPPEDVRARMKERIGARWGRKKQAWYIRDRLVPVDELTEAIGCEPLALIEGRAPTRTWDYNQRLARVQLSLFGGPEPVIKAPASASGKLAARFRAMAEKMVAQIEDKRRPMSGSGTPRQVRMYNERLHDAANLERGRRALLALAEAHENGMVPEALAGLRHKKDVLELVRTRHGSDGGYYSYYDSGEYAHTSEAGRTLQALIDGTPGAREAELRALEVQRLEAKVKMLVGQIPGFFPTPEDVARQLVALAGIRPGMRVLEPSAGSGAIADVIREECPEAELEVIERHLTLLDLLEAKGHEIVEHDFFAVNGQRWDRIVQNPPFERLQDVDHIRWAYERLAEGGRLVSVVSESPFFRDDAKAREFRGWLDEVGYEEVCLDAGAFRESGTGVKARVVVIDKV